MRDALRTCLQIAGGLTEATRRRTTEAARDLLDQAGVDVQALQERIGAAIPAEVQTLADELIASGRANRDLLLGIIREEIDKAMSRVGRLADEVTKVGVVLESLERRIRNLEAPEPAKEPPSEPRPTPRVEHVTVEPEPEPAPSGEKPEPARPPVAKKAPAKKAPAKRAPAKKTATPGTTTAAAKKTPAKRTPAKKATAKKTAAKKTPGGPAKKTAPAKQTPRRPGAGDE